MKGMELSKQYFKEYGLSMLEEKFPDLMPMLAAGLTGSGSECFGFDDEISQDHDFEPGFCIFLPGEISKDVTHFVKSDDKLKVSIDLEKNHEKLKFQLQREYDKLPAEYMGFKRPKLQPVGGNRRGVMHIENFFKGKCGSPDGNLDVYGWLSVPEYSLAEAVNGEIFLDNLGLVTSIREKLSAYPHDIRLKKLAGYLLIMAQAGQYNYGRCVDRGESAAAQMAVYKFVEAGMHVIFLLNRKYMPYYKWSFKALKTLDRLGNMYDSLEFLISSDNDGKRANTKQEMIEDMAALIIRELKADGVTDAVCNDLEKHAYSVNDHIKDGNLRNLDIFSGV